MCCLFESLYVYKCVTGSNLRASSEAAARAAEEVGAAARELRARDKRPADFQAADDRQKESQEFHGGLTCISYVCVLFFLAAPR